MSVLAREITAAVVDVSRVRTREIDWVAYAHDAERTTRSGA